jgi:integron integrase
LPPAPPRLLDQLRLTARQRGHTEPTVAAFADWSRRFILFHGKRHPRELGRTEVGQFLESVAQTEKDPVRALAAGRDALDFLYREVLHLDLGELPLPRPPCLLDRVRQVLRVRHYALSTEECYVRWITRFIHFHGKRHPCDLGAAEVEEFLTHLAVDGHVSASTQNQALNALVFLYQQVLEIDLGRFDAVRARRPKRLPVVLAPEEVAAVLQRVEGCDGVFRLIARLLYGCGLRLLECCRLRVKDVHLARGQIVVRAGKGNKDRVAMLPRSVRADLERQLEWRRRLHERDLARGVARVELPDALERKYPHAAQELGWQFLFASRQLSHCPRTGRPGRHHVYPASLQRAVAEAGRTAPCPCGSGRKYKHCCWGKGFNWVEDEQGRLRREVPLSAEALVLLEEQRQKFRQQFGRDPGPDDLLFFEAPPLEHVEHQLVEAMKRAGVDPAVIHAFEQTGLLVTEDNQHLIPDHDLRAWQAAVAQYNARHRPPP